LSGGNQQKVVFAKWLMARSRILILDEPTQGIDVGAKEEVYRLIFEFTRQGEGSVIFISSELTEILSVSDRILVMHEGSITAEVAPAEATKENLMRFAVGTRD
jgi:ribose transport system ATP-binding protein